jgi:hypothetical protein
MQKGIDKNVVEDFQEWTGVYIDDSEKGLELQLLLSEFWHENHWGSPEMEEWFRACQHGDGAWSECTSEKKIRNGK